MFQKKVEKKSSQWNRNICKIDRVYIYFMVVVQTTFLDSPIMVMAFSGMSSPATLRLKLKPLDK